MPARWPNSERTTSLSNLEYGVWHGESTNKSRGLREAFMRKNKARELHLGTARYQAFFRVGMDSLITAGW